MDIKNKTKKVEGFHEILLAMAERQHSDLMMDHFGVPIQYNVNVI